MPQTSLIQPFLPVASFIITFILSYSLFSKSSFLNNQKWMAFLLSFIISTIFAFTAGSAEFISESLSIYGVMVIIFVFISAIVGFIGGEANFLYKWLGTGFVLLTVLVFLASGIPIFSELFLNFFSTFNSLPQTISSSLILILITIGVGFILLKS